MLRVHLPSGTKLLGVTATSGTCTGPRPGVPGGTVTCALGDLTDGAVAQQTVALRIALSGKGGSIALLASVESTSTGTQAATPDPALGDNTAVHTTTVTKK